MISLAECRICGSEFEPDSPLRKLCLECRDKGYRKTKEPGMPTHRTIWKIGGPAQHKGRAA